MPILFVDCFNFATFKTSSLSNMLLQWYIRINDYFSAMKQCVHVRICDGISRRHCFVTVACCVTLLAAAGGGDL